jgi:uncharacterized protein YfaS (alpha-2-macroglobulin family)/outer membrane protein assembly factor BamB
LPYRYWIAAFLILFNLAGADARELPRGVAWLWEFADPVSVPPVVSGQIALVVTHDVAFGLRTSDGARLWETRLPANWRASDRPLLVGSQAILPACAGKVVALDLASGQQRWAVEAAKSAPELCAGRLVILEAGSLKALDPATGQVRWRLPGTGVADMAVNGHRILYIQEDKVGLWDLTAGRNLWRESDKGCSEVRLGPNIALAAGTDLVAREPSTGRRLWKLPTTDSFELLGDLVLAWADYQLQAVDARSGQRRWKSNLYAQHLASAGPNLIAASDGYGITLLDRKSGRPQPGLDHHFPPLYDGTRLLLAGQDGHLHIRDPRGRILPGMRNLWGASHQGGTGPQGWAGGKLTLLPAGSALLALGEGPGTVRMAAPTQLSLQVDSPQLPGKVRVGIEAQFARKLSLAVYRLPASPSTTAPTPSGPPLLTTSWQGPAGAETSRTTRAVEIKEPGTYLLELAGGQSKTRQQVVVTPLSLTVKLAPNQVLVQALDIVRQTPLVGALVEIARAEESGAIASGKTDGQGVASWQVADPLTGPLQVRLRRAAEELFFTVEPEPLPSQERIFLQTDRPLYRPGHEVHFKGLAAAGARGRQEPLAGRMVEIEVRDAADNPLLAQQLLTDQWGTFAGRLTLPVRPPLGRYRVSARLDVEREWAHLPFEVQEYRKPPFEVRLKPQSPLVRSGQPLIFDLQASYYFGGPVAGGKVVTTVRRATLTGLPSPGNPGYHHFADFDSETTTELGLDGTARLTIPTRPDSSDCEYLVDVEVTGPTGQVVEGSASALASPWPYGVYLLQESWLASGGQPLALKVVTLDRLARPHPGVVQLEAQKYGQRWETVAQSTIRTGRDGKGVFTWTPPKATGSYRVLATSPEVGAQGTPLDEVSYWVDGPGEGPRAERKLSAERSEYEIGETARLLFQVRQSGPALLTVEGDTLFLSRSFQAKAGAQLLTLPLPADFAPGVTVCISSLENRRLVRDQVVLRIPDTEHKLKLSLRSDRAEYRPGESARIELLVTDPQGQPVDADASLAVVDEALFALRPDQVPSLHETFFGPRANRVQTFLMEPRRDQVAGFQTVPSTPRVRKDFKDTAFWQANLLVSQGKASVSVPLPDNLTRWRATTRASTRAMQVGQATTTLVTNLPLMAQAVLPRFLVEGDACDLLAVISNRGPAAVDVDVELAATAGQLQTTSARLRNLPPDGQGRAESRLRVEEGALGRDPLPPRLEVLVKATSDGQPRESDAEQVSVPILPFGEPYAQGAAGLLAAGERHQESIRVPASLSQPKLELRLAGSPLAAVEGALDYLADYPYGCVEQTMSRFLPTLVAAQAMGDLGQFSPERKEKLAPMVEQGLSALYGYQHSDGGWGWWEQDQTHPYMTGYVISGLSMARRAGYTISDPVLSRGVSSARQQLQLLPPADTDSRVYLAWAMAVAGSPPSEELEKLSALPGLSTYSTALLALAWQSSGQPERAQPLLAELERRAISAGVGLAWPAKALTPHGWTDDDIEATSLAVRALLSANPDSSTARSAVLWLLSQRRKGQWKSTRDTAQAVMALLALARAGEGQRLSGELEVQWDGQTVGTVATGGAESLLQVPAGGLEPGEHRLALMASGGSAIYSYDLTGFKKERELVDLPSSSAGLRLVRTYVVEQPGQLLRWNRVVSPEILSVPSGQQVQVELEFDLPTAMEYLKLEDPRPAGFEVIEDSLDGTVPDRTEHRDAFSAFFFTGLPAGKHRFTYRMRAETPGEYRALPARIELMYHPARFGATPSQRVRVRRPGEAP